MSTTDQIFRWANDNQGVLAIAIFVAPAGWIVVSYVFKKFGLFGLGERKSIAEEFAHAEKLKKEVEEKARWEEQFGSYGEFLVRDADRKLPNTEENHSEEHARHSILVLTKIHKEHLEFTSGSLWARYIRKVGDSWFFANKEDEEAILVEHIFWINYRDIVFVRWETDDYWEWPQVCCRLKTQKKFPFSRAFFAERKTGLPQPFYSKICLLSEVSELPEGLRGQ